MCCRVLGASAFTAVISILMEDVPSDLLVKKSCLRSLAIFFFSFLPTGSFREIRKFSLDSSRLDRPGFVGLRLGHLLVYFVPRGLGAPDSGCPVDAVRTDHFTCSVSLASATRYCQL